MGNFPNWTWENGAGAGDNIELALSENDHHMIMVWFNSISGKLV